MPTDQPHSRKHDGPLPQGASSAIAEISQLEFRRRNLLNFAVDLDRQAVNCHGTPEAEGLRVEAHAARLAAKELGARL